MRNVYKTDVSIRPFILPFSASPKGRKKEGRKEGLLVAACQHGYHSVLAAGCLYTPTAVYLAMHMSGFPESNVTKCIPSAFAGYSECFLLPKLSAHKQPAGNKYRTDTIWLHVFRTRVPKID